MFPLTDRACAIFRNSGFLNSPQPCPSDVVSLGRTGPWSAGASPRCWTSLGLRRRCGASPPRSWWRCTTASWPCAPSLGRTRAMELSERWSALPEEKWFRHALVGGWTIVAKSVVLGDFFRPHTSNDRIHPVNGGIYVGNSPPTTLFQVGDLL